MYQLLALDLDGTALKSDFTVSSELKRTINKLSELIPVVIVTGRHHTTAGPYYKDFGLQTPAICCNGTYLYDYHEKRVLHHNAIDKEVAQQFLQYADNYDLNVVVYLQDCMLYSSKKPIMHVDRLAQWANRFSGDIKPLIHKVNNFSDHLEAADYVWKFVVEGRDVDGFAKLPFIRKHFTGEKSWIDRIDFSSIGNTKGTALSALLSQMGINAEQTVAIGDHHNDISMLKMVGMGIAMGNADDIVKLSASKVIDANNDDDNALADVIEALFSEHFAISRTRETMEYSGGSR